MNLTSRTVVLTGATRGLGRALVDPLAARGHTVVGCGRSTDALASLRATYPAPHRFDAVDVGQPAALADWTADLLATHGAPDLVLANAGVINASAPLWEVPAGELDAVIDVNLKGVAHLARGLLPAMIARGRGVFVGFSSGWGRSTAPDVAPYCATKWAIEGLIGALAQELPPGLAAVAYNPGIIHTRMLVSCFGAGAASFPEPEHWATGAATELLALGPDDNGRAL